MSDKKKDEEKKEPTGPFGVGKTWEDIEGLKIEEAIKDSKGSPFDDLIKGLSEKDKKYVQEETIKITNKYQGILEGVLKNLKTPGKQ